MKVESLSETLLSIPGAIPIALVLANGAVLLLKRCFDAAHAGVDPCQPTCIFFSGFGETSQ